MNISLQVNKRHLPHIDEPNHYQFITFRTLDSMDSFLKKITYKNLSNRQRQLVMDQHLDKSKKGAYLNGEILLLLNDFFKSKDSKIYELIAFCIMPNHVHILIKPLDKLIIVMKLIKGGSAKLINKKMVRSESFWATDYYDRLIRNEKHFLLVYQYIKNNPLVLSESNDLHLRFFGIYE